MSFIFISLKFLLYHLELIHVTQKYHKLTEFQMTTLIATL